MRILIIGFSKIKYMPYLNFYLDNLNKEKNEIEILYWNRDLQSEDLSHYSNYKLHEFKCAQKDDTRKILKILSFFKFKKYAKKVIKSGEYDFIFVLHSLPGVLLKKILCKKFQNRFIFDYRDSTYESFKPFKKIVGDLVIASKFTFVSSDAFRKYLPESQKDKTITSHNILLDSLNHRDDKAKYGTTSDKIRIAFWGFIRHEEINRAIIEKLANDDRFELHYYGREQQIALNLKQFAKQKTAKNVFFHGEYTPEQRYDFVKNTDIIHNIYHDNNTMLAMGNKFYDGIVFKIPQICFPNSFMGKKVKEFGVGTELNPNEEFFADNLYEYYKSINFQDFYNNCNKILQRVLEEYNIGKDKVYKL